MKQIIALGGGGFSMEPENPLLDLYILDQSNKVFYEDKVNEIELHTHYLKF